MTSEEETSDLRNVAVEVLSICEIILEHLGKVGCHLDSGGTKVCILNTNSNSNY